jgi:hypothetical protein
VQVVAHGGAGAFDRTVHRGERRVHCRIEIPRQLLRERLEQRLDPGVVVVERAADDARFRTDVLDAGVATVRPSEELEGRAQQIRTGARAPFRPDLGAARMIDPASRTFPHGLQMVVDGSAAAPARLDRAEAIA